MVKLTEGLIELIVAFGFSLAAAAMLVRVVAGAVMAVI
jgi:hypothetical protein